MKLLYLFLIVFNCFAKTEHIVEMHKHSFSPSISKIKKGDVIKFVNKSKSSHNVVIKDLNIRTKMVGKNGVLWLTFDQVGVFDYYCQPHKNMGMVGRIEVAE